MIDSKITFKKPLDQGDVVRKAIKCDAIGLYGFEGDGIIEFHFDGQPSQKLSVVGMPQQVQNLFQTLIAIILEVSRGEWEDQTVSKQTEAVRKAKLPQPPKEEIPNAAT